MGCTNSKEAEDGFDVQPGAPKSTAAPSSHHGFRDPSILIQKINDKVTEAGKNVTGAAHHVRNVFATPFEALDLDHFKIGFFSKSSVENELIQSALKKNFVFEHLSAKELKPLVGAFEKTTASKDEVIIKQGDEGNFFYIIASGECYFTVDGNIVGKAKQGDSFGELALLYNCPRAATVTAFNDVELFRVDQKTFRFILQDQTKKGSESKIKLLKGIPFLTNLAESDISKLTSVMTPKKFAKGEFLIRKGEAADNFYIIESGTVKARNIQVGDAKYEDIEIGPGGFGGERAIMTGEPRAADLVAVTDGLAFVIDKDTFHAVLGNLQDLITKAQDKQLLQGIKVLNDSELDPQIYATLASMIGDRICPAGTKLCVEGEDTEAALYLIRSGKIKATKSGTSHELSNGAYVGEDQLMADAKRKSSGPKSPTRITAAETLEVVEDTVVGVLTLASCRKVLNTKFLGSPHGDVLASMKQTMIEMKDLKKHSILGAGTFGQVWLVSAKNAAGEREPYALKIQSKYELCQDGQAKAVVNEKNIMAKMNHPFLIRLVNTYQDDKFVYMLLGLVQGGELYSVIHGPRRHGLPDKDAKFYAAGIAEGLAYMHRRGFVYRDLKPENVLIDARGYCVIVDFGFAKYVEDKTYTLCGTPLYLPPEVILNRGHNWAADHWSLGVMIFEMLTGETPFYAEGMEQMDLFRAIVKSKYKIPRKVTPQAASIIQGFVNKNTSQRLGSLKGGEDDVLGHHWFNGIDFEQLRQQEVKAPFVPKIRNPLDASNFDDWGHLEDKTKKKYPKLTPQQEAIFVPF